MDDAKLIELLKKNPEEGIFQATIQYGPLVKGIAIKVLQGKRQDVEECVADTFIVLWKKIKDVNLDKGTLKGYIACIARNTAINRYNKLKREKSDSIEDKDFAEGESIEDKIAMKSDITEIQAIIKDMGEPDTEIFTRRFFLFERVRDIAHRLGVTEKVVESRLYRGKKRLRKILMERGVTI